MKIFRSLLLVSLLSSVLSLFGFGQNVDINVPGTNNPYLNVVSNKTWGTLNANYILNPITTDSTVCVYIQNNNPSSSHTMTMALSSTGDQSVTAFANNPTPWVSVPIINVAFPVTINASSTSAFFYKSQAAAKLALVITGASTQAGSPDTVNINVVQPSTSSTCGAAPNAAAVTAVFGATGEGNTVSSGVNGPVLVGGKQMSAGTQVNTAVYADVDPTSHGFMVGTINSANEATGSYQAWAPNVSNNGAPMVVDSEGMGQQSDTVLGGGAGSTLAAMRVSKAYGLMVSNAWQWGATQEAGGTQSPLQSFQAQKDAVNPAAGALLLSININNATNQGFTPYRMTVSCSAACDYTINRVSNAGTTCSAVTVVKAFDPAVSGASLYLGASTGTCVANPTITQTLYHFWLAAGGTQSTDMTGYSYQRSATNGVGFDIQNGTALTGTASVTIEAVQRGAQQ